MAQLIVSLEDTSAINEIRKAIRLLKGVVSVKITKNEAQPNATTVKAIDEADKGHTTVCRDFDSYLELVGNELPD